jgi:phosphoserine phosphatase
VSADAASHTGATALVTLTGADRPGLTAAVFAALDTFAARILDVEQICIHGRLVLGIDLGLAPGTDTGALELDLRATADALGLSTELVVSPAPAVPETADAPAGAIGPETVVHRGSGRARSHVTVLSPVLPPGAIAVLAGRIAAQGANIDRIQRIAAHPVTVIELDVSGADPAALRRDLAGLAPGLGVDVAVQPAGLYRRAKRLVVLDVDSTLITGEVVEILAEVAGCGAEVTRITAAAMRGELDFASSLRERVALLTGLDERVLDEVRAGLTLTPGAQTLIATLRRLDYRCGIVSGGFTQIIDVLAAELHLDHARANTLEIAGGRLTGRLVGPIVDRPGKAAALREFAALDGVPLTQTVAIGDGANDLDMLAAAGLGIAFNAKPAVRAAADTSVTVPYLDTVLYLLGVTGDDLDAD